MLAGSSEDTNIYVWDTRTGAVKNVVRELLLTTFGLAISPDGKSVMAVYRDANEPHGNTPILLWSTESGQVLRKSDSPELRANGGGFLSDGRMVYSTANGNELRVWSLR